MSNSFSRFLLFPFDFIDELFRSFVAGVAGGPYVLDGTPAT